jgi:hypothetical protein
MSQSKSILSRRKFLLTMGAGSVATAAATVAATKAQQQSTREKEKDKRAGAGYSESAHIRNYYRTTKV